MDYREIRSGVWFPMRGEIWSTLQSEANGPKNIIRVTDIKAGRQIPEEELRVTFPSGTRVEVVGGIDYVVP